MSDQSPPPGQPTPPPAEGADDGVEHDQGTPPPPPGDTTTGDAYPPPPAPKQKSRTGLIIAIVAALVVLAIVAVLVLVFVVNKGDDEHSITIPATAGGMKRDSGKEAELQQQLDAAEKQFKSQFEDVSYVKSGVYNQDDSKRGPEGALVFLGAKLKDSEKNADTFISRFRKQATTNGFEVASVKTGDAGGKAACASQSEGQKVAICAWATTDSGGELVPTVPGWDAEQLSKVMTSLRNDVEKTE